eukprot:COSAG06_NODE_67217_length_252_cov_1.013072_1_plen_31_part_10
MGITALDVVGSLLFVALWAGVIAGPLGSCGN